MTAPLSVTTRSMLAGVSRTTVHMTVHATIATVALVMVAAGARPTFAQGIADREVAKATDACQKTITKAGGKFVATKLKKLGNCALGVLKCIQTKPGETKCAAKADANCTLKVVPAIDAAETKFRAQLDDKCGGLTVATLLDADGLGYDRIAADCLQDFGIQVGSVRDVLDCVVHQHRRVAERLFTAEQARARELVTLGGVAPDVLPDLAALESCDGCASTSPEGIGKAIQRCATAVAKSATTFAVRTLTGIESCAQAAFSCVQRKPNDPRCLSKVKTKCDKLTAKLAAARDTLDAAIDDRCGEASVPFDMLRAPAGVGLDALAAECDGVETSEPTSLAGYRRCLRRQHESQLADLLPFASPRAEELFGTLPVELRTVLCPASESAQSIADAAARSSAAIAVPRPFGIRRFISSVFRAVGNHAVPATYVPGGAVTARLAVAQRLQIVSARSQARPGGANTITFRYRAGGASAGLQRASGAADVNPTLVIASQRNACASDDSFELPLDPLPPGVTEGEVDVDVTFPQAIEADKRPFPLQLATKSTNGVDAVTTLEQTPSGGPLRRVKDIFPGEGGSFPYGLKRMHDKVFFAADDGEHGFELWRSDGTEAGTFLVKDLNPGPASSGIINDQIEVNDLLYFGTDTGLFRTDGTPDGTMSVSTSGRPDQLTDVNGTVFFVAPKAVFFGGSYGLYETDGTPDGTKLLYFIESYSLDPAQPISNLINVNGTLFFVAYTSSPFGFFLYKSNGTPEGTVIVSQNAAGGFTAVGSILFFDGNDGYRYRTDGTPAGTVRVDDFTGGQCLGGARYSGACSMDSDCPDGFCLSSSVVRGELLDVTDVNGTKIFTADDGIHGRELWKSNGTAASTALLKDINLGPSSSNVQFGPQVMETLFFIASDGAITELWKTDGTIDGTVPVRDAARAAVAAKLPRELTPVGGDLFFSAEDDGGRELWRANAAGAKRVKDIFPGVGSSDPFFLMNVGGRLLFNADDGRRGFELSESDGSAAGTGRVRDLLRGSDSGAFLRFDSTPTNVDATLFFHSDDGELGDELWALTE